MDYRDIKVGTEIYIGCRGRGGHGAYITVTKLNKATFNGIERAGSYAPGTQWRIGYDREMAIVTYDGNRTNSDGKVLVNLMRKHWFHMNHYQSFTTAP